MINRNKQRQEHFPEFIEIGIILLIVLVIVHTFVDELSIIYRWNFQTTFYIFLISFVFDLIFSVEFSLRSLISLRRGDWRRYFQAERGWVDFFSSFPLLFLVTGPELVLHLMGTDGGGSVFNILQVLKTAKAIRVTRVLRLIRVIKLFGKVQNTESIMTNRHVGAVSTIAVASILTAMVVGQYLPFMSVGDHVSYVNNRVEQLGPVFRSADGSTVDATSIHSYLEKTMNGYNDDVIAVKTLKGESVFDHPDKEALMRTAFADPFVHIKDTPYLVAVSFHRANIDHAKVNLLVLFMILVIISSFVLFYTRIFAQQVADPIYIMDKGIRQWDYNLEVKVLDHYYDEEIYSLARSYNVRWLPLKSQIRRFKKEKTHEKSVLSMDGLF